MRNRPRPCPRRPLTKTRICPRRTSTPTSRTTRTREPSNRHKSLVLGVALGHKTPPRVMPKVKTHSGAKKRFKRTASGKFKFAHVFKRHLLTGRSKKRKRQARNG